MFFTEYDNPDFLLRTPPAPGAEVTGDDGVGPATQPAGMAVQVNGLSKVFGRREVLRDLNLRIDPGEFVAIVGRSGCGKSTLLRVLAGLERPSQGVVALDGQQVAGSASEQRGDVRIMFQDTRLLPWKRVAANVGLGLRGSQAAARERGALAEVGLPDRAHDWPSTLSGGQRQRVALARALVHTPRLLLLDEPLGALDALTRIEMQRLIEKLWRAHGFTAVLVTHDVSEAVTLADRVLLVEDGRITLDEHLHLARPRTRGNARLAEIEARVLARVMGETFAPAEAPQGPGQEDASPRAGHALPQAG